MKQKKNIDQLFKDRFAEHEVTPPPHVWENIQAQLQEKDRDIIPLWWKVAGIAASLVLLFTIGNTLFNNTSKSIVEETQILEEGIKAIPEIKKDLEMNTNENATQVAEKNNIERLKEEHSLENKSQKNPSKKITKKTN
jgi:hypothetical protein